MIDWHACLVSERYILQTHTKLVDGAGKVNHDEISQIHEIVLYFVNRQACMLIINVNFYRLIQSRWTVPGKYIS